MNTGAGTPLSRDAFMAALKERNIGTGLHYRAAHLYPYLPFGTAILGEVPLMLWLIVKGVDARSWEERAAAGRSDL